MKPLSLDSGARPLWDDKGWLSTGRRSPSPNFNDRPPGMAIDLLVIHYVSLPPGRFSGDAVEDLFLNRLDCSKHPYFEGLRDLRVSAHFLIRRSGALIQFVSADQRAWHAGVSEFEGRQGCNDFSIGVELEGDGEHAFTGRQQARLLRLTRQLVMRYPLRAVRGHSDIAPGRKSDPGPFFDWQTYGDSLLRLSSHSSTKIFLKERLQTVGRSALSR